MVCLVLCGQIAWLLEYRLVPQAHLLRSTQLTLAVARRSGMLGPCQACTHHCIPCHAPQPVTALRRVSALCLSPMTAVRTGFQPRFPPAPAGRFTARPVRRSQIALSWATMVRVHLLAQLPYIRLTEESTGALPLSLIWPNPSARSRAVRRLFVLQLA